MKTSAQSHWDKSGLRRPAPRLLLARIRSSQSVPNQPVGVRAESRFVPSGSTRARRSSRRLPPNVDFRDTPYPSYRKIHAPSLPASARLPAWPSLKAIHDCELHLPSLSPSSFAVELPVLSPVRSCVRDQLSCGVQKRREVSFYPPRPQRKAANQNSE